MPLLKDLTIEELKKEYSILQQNYNKYEQQHLNLNLARGKPSAEQLNLSNDMLLNIDLNELLKSDDNVDLRNYGLLSGTIEAKTFFANILDVPADNIIVGGNSSLKLMYDYIDLAMNFGILKNKPWNKLEKIKFLCPSPGYDRHFAICEQFNIEMIVIKLNEDGPDMQQIEKLVQSDDSIKGIWCVPKYSNPTGITYSDEVVKRFASLKPAAKDFRILWDNAYIIHHLDDKGDNLLNIFKECEKFHTEDSVIEFTSTSKITFPGSGISAIAATKANIEDILKVMGKQTIGNNKINQMLHCRFLSSPKKLAEHMKKHAKIIKPKFDLVLNELEKQIKPLGIGSWSKPKGGYFISFESQPNCAKRIYELCKQAGLTLTEVGATYPYKKDIANTNIRLAPTYPTIDELKIAIDLFCLSVKIAAIEKMLK